MTITIDGPAGSGKSTAGRGLAQRLNIAYLDTGAMYRAIAYRALEENADLGDPQALFDLARRSEISVDGGPAGTRVRVNGREVTDAIRTLEVSRATSAVAAVQAVRALLVEKQRAMGVSLGSFVAEGRDQGSVVFPDADVKFVLEASAQRRAERRLEEFRAAGQPTTFEQVLGDVQQRDAVDEHQWEPLLRPGRAIRIDTTALTLEEVIDLLVRHVQNRRD